MKIPLWKTRSTGVFGLVSGLFRGFHACRLVNDVGGWRARPVAALDDKSKGKKPVQVLLQLSPVRGFAASAVADSLKTSHRPAESPTTVVDGKIAADVLNTAIEGLKTALSASQEQNAALARELDAKNSQIASLQEQVASQQRTIDRLSNRSWLDRVFGRGLPPASTE